MKAGSPRNPLSPEPFVFRANALPAKSEAMETRISPVSKELASSTKVDTTFDSFSVRLQPVIKFDKLNCLPII